MEDAVEGKKIIIAQNPRKHSMKPSTKSRDDICAQKGRVQRELCSEGQAADDRENAVPPGESSATAVIFSGNNVFSSSHLNTAYSRTDI